MEPELRYCGEGGSMKAKIDATGVLKVSAETELESYALRRWADENHEVIDGKSVCDKVLVTWGIESQTVE